MRSRSTKIVRLVVFLGLLALEMSLIFGFWIFPQFEARNAPDAHLEMESPLRDSMGTRVAIVAFLSLLAAGNVGLIIAVRRAFKELTIDQQERIG